MKQYKFYLNSIEIDDPVNWDDIKHKLLRDSNYFGLIRKHSLDKLKLHGNAIEIVKNERALNGLKSQLYLYIEELCPETLKYKLSQTAIIKVDTIKENFTIADGNTLLVDLVDNNFYEKIVNRENINVVLGSAETIEGETTSLPSRQFTEVEYHSRGIILETRWVDGYYDVNDNPEDFINYRALEGSNSSPYDGSLVLPLKIDFNNVPFSSGTAYSKINKNDLNNDTTNITGDYLNYALSEENIFLTESSEDKNVKITYNITLDLASLAVLNAVKLGIRIYRCTYDGVEFDHLFETATSPKQVVVNGYQTMTFTGEFNFPKKSNYLYFAVIEAFEVTGTYGILFNNIDISMEMTYIDYIEDSNHKSMMIYEALQSCLEQITDTPDILVSNVFGRPVHGYDDYGKYSKIALTNGYFLRNAINSDNSDVSIEINFKEMFRTLTKLFGLAFWYDENDGKIHIEEREDAFLTEVQEIELQEIENEISNQFIISDLIVGGKNIKYENINGANEFNTVLEFNTPFNVKQKKLDLVAGYQTDYLGIELARQVGFSTDANVDSKYDDKNFLVELKGTEDDWKTRKGEDYEQVFDIPLPLTAGNLLFSPKRSLLRNSDLINASFWINQNEELKFIKANNLSALTSKDYGENLLVERDYVQASDMKKLFKPILWSGNIAKKDIIKILTSQGLVKFVVGCQVVQGWVWDAEIKNGLANVKILEKW